MNAMPSDMHALRARFDDEVITWPGVKRATLFGHPAYALQRKVFAFFDEGEVIVKAPELAREALLVRVGAYVWTPPGAGMKRFGNWVGMPTEHFADDDLVDALSDAYEGLAASLAPTS